MAEEAREAEHAKFTAWMLRVFGSAEAYLASLPRCTWVQGANGLWTSVERW